MSTPTGAYVAVPVEAVRLVLGRYCRGDTSVDDASDLAVIALSGALDRYDDHDGTTWPAVQEPSQSGDSTAFGGQP